MNTTTIITAIPDRTSVVASFSAPRDTSAPSVQERTIFAVAAPAQYPRSAARPESSSYRYGLRQDPSADSTASAPFFVHSRNVGPPPVGRGLAQPTI
jgi:hypothetical protein